MKQMKTFLEIRESKLGSLIDKAHKQQQLHTRGGQASGNASKHHHAALDSFASAKQAHKNGNHKAAKQLAHNAVAHSLYTSVWDGFKKGVGDEHHNKLAKHIGMGDLNKSNNSDKHMKHAKDMI